jgi:hypothetical protein
MVIFYTNPFLPSAADGDAASPRFVPAVTQPRLPIA